MKVFLLSVHVLAAILCVGPVTVAASVFPRYAIAATGDGASAAATSAAAMHRISRVYAVLSVSVPVFGIATAAVLGVLGETWVIVSMALTLLAAVLLAAGVVPLQRRVLADLAGSPVLGGPRPTSIGRLRMMTGMFSLTWAVVVVLMIMRPGSTTGV